MAKEPAVLFYTDDFLSGTFTMTNEQVGMYIRLLCLQHQKGRLREKDMLSICSTHDEEVFCKFEKDEAGMYYNKRMEHEAEKRRKFADSRRKNALGGDKDVKEDKKKPVKNKNTSEAYAQHMGNGNGIVNVIENEDGYEILQWPSFSDFWEAYDKKRGDKDKLAKKWDKLPQAEKEAIMDYIPRYLKAVPDKQYRKDPQTFLNNKSWNDEIIENGKSSTNTRQSAKDIMPTPDQLGLDQYSKLRNYTSKS